MHRGTVNYRFFVIWISDYESAQGPYTFRLFPHMSHMIWLIDYESAPGPYTFRFFRHMTHRLWVSLRTVYFPQLHLWFIDYPGPYTFAGPFTFLYKTVNFQILKTVYFRRPYSFSQKTAERPYTFSSRTVYFQSGPYTLHPTPRNKPLKGPSLTTSNDYSQYLTRLLCSDPESSLARSFQERNLASGLDEIITGVLLTISEFCLKKTLKNCLYFSIQISTLIIIVTGIVLKNTFRAYNLCSAFFIWII